MKANTGTKNLYTIVRAKKEKNRVFSNGPKRQHVLE